jgi:hypothetical protein
MKAIVQGTHGSATSSRLRDIGKPEIADDEVRPRAPTGSLS